MFSYFYQGENSLFGLTDFWHYLMEGLHPSIAIISPRLYLFEALTSRLKAANFLLDSGTNLRDTHDFLFANDEDICWFTQFPSS